MTPRSRLARWNLLAAQAHLDVTMARVNRKPSAALEAWAEICEMRRTQAQEDLTPRLALWPYAPVEQAACNLPSNASLNRCA